MDPRLGTDTPGPGVWIESGESNSFSLDLLATLATCMAASCMQHMAPLHSYGVHVTLSDGTCYFRVPRAEEREVASTTFLVYR